ncbi:MAG: hypothetical protein HOP11_10490 [Saprospiraceae bacterium]|nr:hypothetical protein [Saprospiraceae bacterium]
MAKSKKTIPDKSFQIGQGIQLLEQWIFQLLDHGIEVLSKDKTRLEDISLRLLDYGIPSIAKRLRLLPDKINTDKGWKETILQELGEYLIMISIFKKNTDIQKEELLRYLSTPQRKADVEKLNYFIEDSWIYLGTIRIKEENILVVRNWFIGIETGKAALYIEYIFNRFVAERKFEWGKCYTGKVYYYPSQVPLRVTQIPSPSKSIPLAYLPKVLSIREFQKQWANEIIKVPWLKQKLLLIRHFKLVKHDNQYFINDDSELLLPLQCEPGHLPELIAFSLDIKGIFIGEYDDLKIRPLSVIHESGLIGIQ